MQIFEARSGRMTDSGGEPVSAVFGRGSRLSVKDLPGAGHAKAGVNPGDGDMQRDSAGASPNRFVSAFNDGIDASAPYDGAPEAAIQPDALPSGVSSIVPNVFADAVGTVLGLNASVLYTVTFSSATNVTADSTILLNNGGVATYVSGSGTTTATYQYVVGAGQSTSALSVVGYSASGAATDQGLGINSNTAIDTSFTSPSDTDYAAEWYVNSQYGTHADRVWPDYTGAGVTVGVFDEGIEYTHPDLAANLNIPLGYNAQYDLANGDTSTAHGDADSEADDDTTTAHNGNRHGTSVAGLIAAARNGSGAVGVAYDATLYSEYLNFAAPDDPTFAAIETNGFAYAEAHADIVNDSWGTSSAYFDSFDSGDDVATGAALASAATHGRHGLGTIIVQSAGNNWANYQDTNVSSYSNNRFAIVVGASSAGGKLYGFSNRGASLLLTAPGGEEVTTDRLGTPGYNATGDYTDTSASYFSGTSGSAPETSGVVALMLQANPNLGARDVQEILAYSAQPSASASGTYLFNHAANWNGGGLRYNNAVGFGIIDALAAVRLAETWTTQDTWSNAVSQTAGSNPNLSTTVTTFNEVATTSTTLHIDGHQSIDRVDLYVDIDATYAPNVSVYLTSPDGTVSTLLDRPGVAPNGTYSNLLYKGDTAYLGDTPDGIHFTLDSTQFWGEDASGDWTITVKQTNVQSASETDTLTRAQLTIYGDAWSADTTYYYTNAYANNYHGQTLTDSDGGHDTINAAAVTAPSTVDLSGAAASNLGGTAITLADDHVADVYAGDGNDLLTGNALGNVLYGERGNDMLAGGAGNDVLNGGRGDDTMDGGDGFDTATYADALASVAVNLGTAGAQVTGGAGTDTLTNIEALTGSAFNDTLTGDANANVLEGGAGNDAIEGGDGFDTASYAGATAGVTVTVGLAGAQDTGGAGTDTLTNIEALAGSAYKDTLTSTLAVSTIAVDDSAPHGSTGTAVSIDGAFTLAGGATTPHVAAHMTGTNEKLLRFTVDQEGVTSFTVSGAGFDGQIELYNANGAFIGGSGFSANHDYYSADLSPGVWYVGFTPNGASDPNATYTLDVAVPGHDLAPAGGSLSGGAGNDMLIGGAGDDTLDGGDGTDTASYAVAGGGVTVSLAATAAQATGGAGSDTLANIENLTGSAFADALTGTAGANYLRGGAGNDNIQGGGGADILEGDGGYDRILFADATSGVTVSLNVAGYQTVGAWGSDEVSGIEAINGSAFDDTLIGNAQNNIFNGGGGNDMLIGGAGNDQLNGGSGIDTVDYSAASVGVHVDLSNATAQNTQAGSDTLTTIENLLGGAYNDVLTGSSVANVLVGGAGVDKLDGGLKADTLTGGAGNDKFYFTTTLGASNIDTITDFTVGQDRIVLDHNVFAGLSAGALSAGAFDTGSAASDADDRIIYDGITGALSFDRDGNGSTYSAVRFATLSTGLTTLSASSFSLV